MAFSSLSSVNTSGHTEPLAGHPVLRPRRREDVEHPCTLGPGPHRVRHAARGAPEVALLHRDLLAALDADGAALEQHAPLLLGVAVQRTGAVRRDGDDREHGALAREDVGIDPRRELAPNAARWGIEIMELVGLADGWSPSKYSQASSGGLVPQRRAK